MVKHFFLLEVPKIREIQKIYRSEKRVYYRKTVVKLAGQCVGAAHSSSSFVSTAYNKLHWTL